MEMDLKIETPSGIYVLKKPRGKAGVKWLNIMLETSVLFEHDIRDLPLEERKKVMGAIGSYLERFTEEVLPDLYISGPFTVNDIPADDLFEIYMTLMTSFNPPKVTQTFQPNTRMVGNTNQQ